MKTLSFAVRMVLLTFCLLLAQLSALAADVVYIERPTGQSYFRQQVATAASFYGLEMDSSVITQNKDDVAALDAIRSPKAIAVVVDARALPNLDRERVLASIQRHGNGIPLFIVGIDEHIDSELLRQWSFGAITGCQRSATSQVNGSYDVASGNDVTRQLGGSKLPLSQREVSYLTFDNSRKSQVLMQARFGADELPVFARITVNGQNVFFATAVPYSETPVTSDPYREQPVFAAMAAPMMFLRFAAGERAWHSTAEYANLTIDDVWLREPYGYVNYEGLLQQAQQHNFHATMAFIPWNFDRSQPQVVSLFQDHPDRLSICVHGNNHIHQEFGPLAVHPLNRQEEDIKQSLARMERFRQLTHIPYDAVMVFPHSISPEATLRELKRYNFLATANSLNVPSDAATPPDADFVLRTASLHFAGFPSLRRYSAETDIPEPQLAIDAFLGNPMLFYAHESYFSPGIGAFNKMADTVNQIQPGIQWKGLGYIAHHLYLEKLRDDGNFDIRAYSGTIDLFNDHKRDAVFYIEKDEDFAQPFSVFVDGQPYPFERSGKQLRLQLTIQDGMSKEITIRYSNNLNLAGTDISKQSLRVSIIRHLSDFRDDVVSRSPLGRRFIVSYRDNGDYWNGAMFILAVLLILLGASWYRHKRRRSASVPIRRSE